MEEDVSQSLAGLIHDARSMVSAIDLYCDLLEEPEVLAPASRHYAGELRLVGAASRRLLQKLALVHRASSTYPASEPAGSIAGSASSYRSSGNLSGIEDESRFRSAVEALAAFHRGSNGRTGLTEDAAYRHFASVGRREAVEPCETISNLAAELQANRNLLSALAGPRVTVGLSVAGGACAVAMTGGDLTRVLINLTMNAVEAMPAGGHLQIALESESGCAKLSFTDSGPGIPAAWLEAVFTPDFSTRIDFRKDVVSSPAVLSQVGPGRFRGERRGLGLAIVRSIVLAAGGRVSAANRGSRASHADSPGPAGNLASTAPVCGAARGAIITIELPTGQPTRPSGAT